MEHHIVAKGPMLEWDFNVQLLHNESKTSQRSRTYEESSRHLIIGDQNGVVGDFELLGLSTVCEPSIWYETCQEKR